MEFQLSYFKSWKMMLWKCCTQYASKFGKLSSGHRTGKVSFHSNPKESQCQRMFNLPHNCASKVMLKILQARFQQYMNWELTDVRVGFRKSRSEVKSLSRVWLFATPWTVSHQAPPSMGLSRQEYWSGLPFPSPGHLPDPGIEPRSPTLQADALTSEPPEKPKKKQSNQILDCQHSFDQGKIKRIPEKHLLHWLH